MICSEYLCPIHGRFDCLVDRPAPDAIDCPDCGAQSEWTISAPLGRVKLGEVGRGKSEPPPPHALRTDRIADGMPTGEWRQQRHEARRKAGYTKFKEML